MGSQMNDKNEKIPQNDQMRPVSSVISYPKEYYTGFNQQIMI